ncbi:MAG TPA: thioredoxin TrxC [Gemmatimonadales bacterium]|nr:thioredoxin TrxC [Gemmatimonadales bacterium]
MTVTVPCPFCSTLNRVDLDRVDDKPRCGQCTRPILLDRPLAVSDATFEQVIGASEVPVVVDFYADWCGPCKVMAPVLDQIAHDRQGELLILKLDTDRNPVTAGQFTVRSIPTLIVFERGREVARESGAMPRAHLDALLARVTS